jgi:hypothetical protein
MMACPTCGDPLSVHGVCGNCGYGLKSAGKAKGHNPESAHWGELAARAKEGYLVGVPTSFDLTEQQWYNVCKFWPNVAAHCKRPGPAVGPDHPLDATSSLGPLMRHRRVKRRSDDPDAIEERAAIQAADA